MALGLYPEWGLSVQRHLFVIVWLLHSWRFAVTIDSAGQVAETASRAISLLL